MYLLLKKVWVTKNGYVQSHVSIITIFRSSQGGGGYNMQKYKKKFKNIICLLIDFFFFLSKETLFIRLFLFTVKRNTFS